MADRTCTVVGCESRHKARGYCANHYRQWKTHGDPLIRVRARRGSCPTCTVDGCSRPYEALGLCELHYKRLRKHGDPNRSDLIQGSDDVRFWAQIERDDATGCWLWQGSREANGYVRARMRGRRMLVHRWSYERFVGPIPDGLTIDHVKARGCAHRHCVNPAHLEAVTQAENNRRKFI